MFAIKKWLVQTATNLSGCLVRKCQGQPPSKKERMMNQATYTGVILKNFKSRGNFATARLNDYSTDSTGRTRCVLTTEVIINDLALVDKVASWTSSNGEFTVNITGINSTRFDRRPNVKNEERYAPRPQVIVESVELVNA